MRALRAAHDVSPLVIHASYLINLCSQTESVRVNAVKAFRGEVERALGWGAEYLVLHPGSWKGADARGGGWCWRRAGLSRRWMGWRGRLRIFGC